VQSQLQDKISLLERQLADERSYAMNIFVRGEVQKSCARALVKYEYVTQQHNQHQQYLASEVVLAVGKQESQASSGASSG
jgi:hypothetical protein